MGKETKVIYSRVEPLSYRKTILNKGIRNLENGCLFLPKVELKEEKNQ